MLNIWCPLCARSQSRFFGGGNRGQAPTPALLLLLLAALDRSYNSPMLTAAVLLLPLAAPDTIEIAPNVFMPRLSAGHPDDGKRNETAAASLPCIFRLFGAPSRVGEGYRSD